MKESKARLGILCLVVLLLSGCAVGGVNRTTTGLLAVLGWELSSEIKQAILGQVLRLEVLPVLWVEL
jgi:hypothetical protein